MKKYLQGTIFISVIILLLLAHEYGQFMLHTFFMHVSSGRSSYKILLFIPWMLLSNVSFNPKAWEKKILITCLTTVYTLQIISLKLLNPNLSLFTYRWHVYEKAISSNYIFSVHSNKFITGYITQTFTPFLERSADTGWYYVHMLPSWYKIVVTTLIIASLVLAVRQYQKTWSLQRRIVYMILSFMLLKNAVDGGPFTPEVFVAFTTLLLFYSAPKKIVALCTATVLTANIILRNSIMSIRTLILAAIFWSVHKRSYILLGMVVLISLVTPSQTNFIVDQIQYYNTNIDQPTNVLTIQPCIEQTPLHPRNCTTTITSNAQWKQLITDQGVPINYRPVRKLCGTQKLYSGQIIADNVSVTEMYGESAYVKVYKVFDTYKYDVQLPSCIPSEISYINTLLQKAVQTPFTSVPAP